ncbi:MAG TPA: hypothetical protein VG225_03065 [Terracidiphilus sp.]|nr:hypothetical protein [Terracidiphilus sp.]
MSILQDLRYKLQKRIQRLSSANFETFNSELVRVFDFFDSNSTLRGAVIELQAKFPQLDEELTTALAKRQILEGSTEAEHAAIGLNILKRILVSKSQIPYLEFVHQVSGGFDKALDRFRERYLEPFYEYIDERVDERNLVLSELVRFKHLAEWFRRAELWEKWKSAPRSGEHALAFSVYEFLYEQGVDFQIEPASASGEADMVSAQHSSTPLVADVKIFDPSSSRGSTYILRGFHQVYRYLHDYNQPIGYLVVFKGSEKQLEVATNLDNTDNVPHVQLGDKTIFLIQIDIFPHEEPASKRAIPEREVITTIDLETEVAEEK